MIAAALGALAWARFRAACTRPLPAQAGRLRRILADAAETAFGREHHFARLAATPGDLALMREYRARVPARTAAAMADDLDAVYRGDWRRLCPEPPLWFAMTAGSTGHYKYIPVTPSYRREVGRSSLTFLGALQAAYPEVRGGRTQFLVGSAEGGHSPAGVPQGFASGFNYRKLPFFLRRNFTVPYWVFTLDDAEERAYAAGRILADEPHLAVLCAISPVNLINLRRALERDPERLLHDIATGSLSTRAGAAVPGTWRGRPRPARAEALRAARRRAGRFPSHALFPGLRVLVCWQGGNMSYYLGELRDAFGIDRLFEFPISASEGVFAIPVRADAPGGAVAVTTHFLEFVPRGAATGEARGAHELESGAEYRVLVTNAGGLYRYDMEDLVRVTGRFRETPVIEFVSKASRQVSISNERITELDVTLAMRDACRRCGCWFDEFLFVPCSDRRYRVLLDGDSARLAPGRVAVLADELDAQLRRCAMGYDFEREDALLEPLEVVVTAPGTLRAWLRARAPDDLPNAQAKPMHLTSMMDAHRSLTMEVVHAL